MNQLVLAQVAVQSKRLRSHLQAQVRLLRRIRNQFNHHLQQSQMKKMNQASAVAPKVSSQEQAQVGTTDGGQVAESAAGTDKAKSEKNTNNSQSSLDFGALDNGDISSLVGTWTNANGESVTINADGTIIKNSTGYTAQLKPQRVSDNIFYAGVFSDTSSAALRAISGGSNGSDYLVIGQDQTAEGVPYYRN